MPGLHSALWGSCGGKGGAGRANGLCAGTRWGCRLSNAAGCLAHDSVSEATAGKEKREREPSPPRPGFCRIYDKQNQFSGQLHYFRGRRII